MASRVGFLIILIGFGDPVGSPVLSGCFDFVGRRWYLLSVSYEVCFFVGLGENMIPGSVVR